MLGGVLVTYNLLLAPSLLNCAITIATSIDVSFINAPLMGFSLKQ